MKLIGKTCRIITNVFFYIVLFLSIITIEFYLCGFKPYVVMSGSMEPVMHTGSLCVVDTKVTYGDIQLNDVVAFESGTSDRLVTHRVINITPTGLETKGDANEISDGISVTPENLHGRTLFSIPHLGYILYFIQQPVIMMVIIIFAVLVIVGSFLEPKKKSKKANKKKRKREETKQSTNFVEESKVFGVEKKNEEVIDDVFNDYDEDDVEEDEVEDVVEEYEEVYVEEVEDFDDDEEEIEEIKSKKVEIFEEVIPKEETSLTTQENKVDEPLEQKQNEEIVKQLMEKNTEIDEEKQSIKQEETSSGVSMEKTSKIAIGTAYGISFNRFGDVCMEKANEITLNEAYGIKIGEAYEITIGKASGIVIGEAHEVVLGKNGGMQMREVE